MSAQILLVGCGKMGRAMLDGWLGAGSVSDVAVVEPAGPGALPTDDRVRHLTSADDLGADYRPDAIVLAVKPQAMDGVLPAYRDVAGRGAAVLSIAAGKTIGYFQEQLGQTTAVVRAMPNTPAAIGRGTSVLVAGEGVSQEQRDLAGRLMSAVGSVEWVEEEGLIDAVTALSGGGPAYVFLLVEALAEAGIAAGLSPDMSMRLARSTVSGSGALLDASGEPADILRKNVTSPAGTTEAALRVLMDSEGGIGPIFRRAIAAAADRSRELAG